MTRQQHLAFCKRCLNRKMDLNQGIVCALTLQKADFINTCDNYLEDEKVPVEVPHTPDALLPDQIATNLPEEVYERLKLDQNLVGGIIAGALTGISAAILWSIITVTINYQIGYMAMGVGAAVGFSVRRFGNGIEQIFGIWGAVLALLSVVLGNFLSIIGYFANSEGLGYVQTLLWFDYAYFPEVMMETFSGIDVFFYGLAIYAGYQVSFRKITAQTL
jgi:hypothetical protein